MTRIPDEDLQTLEQSLFFTNGTHCFSARSFNHRESPVKAEAAIYSLHRTIHESYSTGFIYFTFRDEKEKNEGPPS